jgi:ABC-type transport system involved in multi-copper enzyme maturation permease subunit
MATMTSAASAPVGGRAGLRGAVRSEWTKIRSVRSTVWTLLALTVLSIGVSSLSSFAEAGRDNPASAAQVDLVKMSLFGTVLGQLVIVVLGAMTITSEYATGMIRTSLSVQPRRLTLILAKAGVFSAVAFVVGEVISLVSFLIGESTYGARGIAFSLGQPGAARAVFGAGLYLTGCGLLAFGLGALLRHTAGAIVGAFGLLFIASELAKALPQSWQVNIVPYLPMDAGSDVWATRIPHLYLAPWAGFGVFMIYVAAALAGGLTVFLRRDA